MKPLVLVNNLIVKLNSKKLNNQTNTAICVQCLSIDNKVHSTLNSKLNCNLHPYQTIFSTASITNSVTSSTANCITSTPDKCYYQVDKENLSIWHTDADSYGRMNNHRIITTKSKKVDNVICKHCYLQ